MKIDIRNKINYKNFTTILDMLNSVESMNSFYSNIFSDKINLEKYCNVISFKNIEPNQIVKLKKIYMNGRYNIIELIDVPKGTFEFEINNEYDELQQFNEENYNESIDDEVTDIESIDDEVTIENSRMEKMYQKNFYENKKVDNIMKVLRSREKEDNILLIKNQKANKINLENISLKKGKIYYLKNIKSKISNKVPIEANIKYNHGRMILILENTKCNLKIINDSDQFTRCSDFENKSKVIEGFDSSNYYCTSGGEIIIILIIIYLIYKAITAPEIIKIFD